MKILGKRLRASYVNSQIFESQLHGCKPYKVSHDGAFILEDRKDEDS
jgi:hypothetical protein